MENIRLDYYNFLTSTMNDNKAIKAIKSNCGLFIGKLFCDGEREDFDGHLDFIIGFNNSGEKVCGLRLHVQYDSAGNRIVMKYELLHPEIQGEDFPPSAIIEETTGLTTQQLEKLFVDYRINEKKLKDWQLKMHCS